jgi:hypothetical protein
MYRHFWQFVFQMSFDDHGVRWFGAQQCNRPYFSEEIMKNECATVDRTVSQPQLTSMPAANDSSDEEGDGVAQPLFTEPLSIRRQL